MNETFNERYNTIKFFRRWSDLFHFDVIFTMFLIHLISAFCILFNKLDEKRNDQLQLKFTLKRKVW